jgi:hypothetical protein
VGRAFRASHSLHPGYELPFIKHSA